MRRAPIAAAGAVAVLLAAVLLGPRARVTRETLTAVRDVTETQPGAWRGYAADTVVGVTPGAEKGIVWADSVGQRTDVAFVYLHGFSATRREVHPLLDTLGARLGANVFYTRLTGHGLPGDALGSATAADWLLDTAEAMAVGRAIGSRVVLVGTSTGATLAAIEAASSAVEDSPGPVAVVLLSPNFGPADEQAELVLAPWGRVLTRVVAGKQREWTPANEAQARFWTTRYPTRVIPEMMALVDAARRAPIERIDVPVFVAYSGRDQVISPARVREAIERMPTASAWDVTADADSTVVRELATGSFHVFAGDILAPGFTPVVADSIEAFLRRALR